MSGDGCEGQQPSSLSAFRAVGSAGVVGGLVSSPAVKPATSSLRGSPEMSVSPASSEPLSLPLARQEQFPWPSQSTEESRRLLETEGSSEAGDTEAENNSWTITREQLSYYMTQFKTMQPNPRGVIPGAQAKEFFEKSRLPVAELRQIWQLSDVTKDGCLSLEEFLTAMHLVVLRRNDIPLPDELPLCLTPLNLLSRHNSDLYQETSQGQGQEGHQPLLDLTEDSIDGSEEHTEPTLSPESQLSSPCRPKPVKFNSTAVSALGMSRGIPSFFGPTA